MDKWNLGQGAVEFISLVGFLIFIMIVVLALVSQRAGTVEQNKDVLVGEDIVITVQKELNLAASVQDGYFREFTLPLKLAGAEYDIRVERDEVIITSSGQNFWRKIPNVTGMIYKGANHVNKTNGTIYLNQ